MCRSCIRNIDPHPGTRSVTNQKLTSTEFELKTFARLEDELENSAASLKVAQTRISSLEEANAANKKSLANMENEMAASMKHVTELEGKLG